MIEKRKTDLLCCGVISSVNVRALWLALSDWDRPCFLYQIRGVCVCVWRVTRWRYRHTRAYLKLISYTDLSTKIWSHFQVRFVGEFKEKCLFRIWVSIRMGPTHWGCYQRRATRICILKANLEFLVCRFLRDVTGATLWSARWPLGGFVRSEITLKAIVLGSTPLPFSFSKK